MIIAATGLMGSGKSTVIRYLMGKSQKAKLIKFAQPLYDMQSYIYELAHLGQPNMKDRELLQFLGGKWGRGKDINLWCNIWELNYRHEHFFGMRDCDVFADDLRYDNEAAMLARHKAIIIQVLSDRDRRQERIDLTGELDVGESGIDPKFVTATVVNNGTLSSLHTQLDHLYETLNGNNKR